MIVDGLIESDVEDQRREQTTLDGARDEERWRNTRLGAAVAWWQSPDYHIACFGCFWDFYFLVSVINT